MESSGLFIPAIDLYVPSPLAGEGQGEGKPITRERSEHLMMVYHVSHAKKRHARNPWRPLRSLRYKKTDHAAQSFIEMAWVSSI